MHRLVLALAIGVSSLAASVVSGADADIVSLRIPSELNVRANMHLTFHATPLPEGGYYYAVVVLKPYKRYTKKAPPPCSVSSNMQRTNYGYPTPVGDVTLTLTPARSRTDHWCPGGSYEGAIYAVPHVPPCNSTYPCYAEPYEPPELKFPNGQPVEGLVARRSYAYEEGLPVPDAKGTTIAARFTLRS
jgi:hypothetical protein